jgi:hypothetical protein
MEKSSRQWALIMKILKSLCIPTLLSRTTVALLLLKLEIVRKNVILRYQQAILLLGALSLKIHISLQRTLVSSVPIRSIIRIYMPTDQRPINRTITYMIHRKCRIRCLRTVVSQNLEEKRKTLWMKIRCQSLNINRMLLKWVTSLDMKTSRLVIKASMIKKSLP